MKRHVKVYRHNRFAEIKGVRVNYDHLEQIIEWYYNDDFKVEISTIGIDNTYKKYVSIDSLVKYRGKKPNVIVITGTKNDQTIQFLVSKQYCIIEAINRNSNELEYRIVRLMKETIPFLFKLFPFKWFVWVLTIMFVSSILTYFILNKNGHFFVVYTLSPIIAFIVAGIYNNKVNGINLIYSHEKTSLWTRKKDDIILLILSTRIIVPIGSAIWEYLIKPYFKN